MCVCVPAWLNQCMSVLWYKDGLRKLACPLITEISWIDSGANERLKINRLLFSLNSCLSTSLIKTQRWGGKIKAADRQGFQLVSLAVQTALSHSNYTSTPEEGAVPQHMCVRPVGHGCVVLVRLDSGLQFVNQDQQSCMSCGRWVISVIDCSGGPTKFAQHLMF